MHIDAAPLVRMIEACVARPLPTRLASLLGLGMHSGLGASQVIARGPVEACRIVPLALAIRYIFQLPAINAIGHQAMESRQQASELGEAALTTYPHRVVGQRRALHLLPLCPYLHVGPEHLSLL